MKKVKRCFAGVVLVGVVIFISSLMSCKQHTDQQQGEVVLYCSVDQSGAEPIIAEFEKQTGIKILARFDTESSKTVGLVQKIRAESVSPRADVFWSSEILYTIRLASEGLLTEYRNRPTTYWPSQLAGVNGQWYAFGLRARVIGYSTERVSKQEAPRQLEDLLSEKWKGRIVMAQPEFGTTGGDVTSWFVHYGKERAKEILKRLKDNQVRLVEGNSTAVRMVATGQADVCLTDTDDIYSAQRNGWPVAMNYLDQGGDGAFAIPNTASLIKGGPHPHEAAKLMEFLLSEKVEGMLAAGDSHNWPVHTSLANQCEQYAIPKVLKIDYEKTAQQLNDAIVTAREILR